MTTSRFKRFKRLTITPLFGFCWSSTDLSEAVPCLLLCRASWSAALFTCRFQAESEAGPCVDGTAKAVAKASPPADLLDMGEKPTAAAAQSDLLSFDGKTPEKPREADLLGAGAESFKSGPKSSE